VFALTLFPGFLYAVRSGYYERAEPPFCGVLRKAFKLRGSEEKTLGRHHAVLRGSFVRCGLKCVTVLSGFH